MSSELKACLFTSCGSPAMPLHNIGGRSFTRCSNILCSLHQVWTTEDEWNRRAPSPAVKALVEAARPLTEIVMKQCSGYTSGPGFDAAQLARVAIEALAAVEREIGAQP